MAAELDLDRTAALLNDVFGFEPPLTADDVRWYYDDNPVGRASVGRVIGDDGRQMGNYALVPLRLRRSRDGDELVLGLGVDLAVHPDARGGGTFRRTVEHSYEVGTANGLDGILGVANAQSAPRMAKSLGWRVLDPLPVRLLSPLGRSLPTTELRPDILDGDSIEVAPATEKDRYAPVWTADLLRWRTAKARAEYHIHLTDDLVVVSTRTALARLPVAVCLKVLRRAGASTRPVPAGRVGRLLATTHRTPLVVHWGRNGALRLRGLRLPRRAMPSPLELVTHSFHTGYDRDQLELTDFEFLDFDAY